MAGYILSFLSISFIMSMVILLVSVFNALLQQRVQAKFRYAVWLVVLVGLLIPIRPALGDGLFTVPIFTSEQGAPRAAADSSPATARGQDAAATEASPNYSNLSPVTILVTVWAVIALAAFAYHVWRYANFMRIVRRWGQRIEDEETLKLYRAVMEEKGLQNRVIGLVRCKFVSTSMLTGFFKPVIILPDKEFTIDELDMIFRHELIHYKRGDLYIKLLSAIALSIHWFNPIVYWMCSAIQTECEASCDEAVLRDIGEDSKLFYAELIVEMVGRRKTATMLSTCFYGGKRSLKRRLDSIMEGPRKMRMSAYVSLLLIIMLTAMSGSVFAFSVREAFSSIDVTDRSVTPSDTPISAEQAVEIAFAYLGRDDGVLDEVELDFERGQWVWEVEIEFEPDSEVEVYIDIITGEVLWADWD